MLIGSCAPANGPMVCRGRSVSEGGLSIWPPLYYCQMVVLGTHHHKKTPCRPKAAHNRAHMKITFVDVWGQHEVSHYYDCNDRSQALKYALWVCRQFDYEIYVKSIEPYDCSLWR